MIHFGGRAKPTRRRRLACKFSRQIWQNEFLHLLNSFYHYSHSDKHSEDSQQEDDFIPTFCPTFIWEATQFIEPLWDFLKQWRTASTFAKSDFLARHKTLRKINLGGRWRNQTTPSNPSLPSFFFGLNPNVPSNCPTNSLVNGVWPEEHNHFLLRSDFSTLPVLTRFKNNSDILSRKISE